MALKIAFALALLLGSILATTGGVQPANSGDPPNCQPGHLC